MTEAAPQRLETQSPDALVVPTTCDWNGQAVARVADRLPVLRVELPGSEGLGALARELRDLCDGLAEITDFSLTAASLRDALADPPSADPEQGRPRVALSGSPIIWPNFKVPYLVERTGGVVVGDDFCSRASRLTWPDIPSGSLRDMLAALARRALEPCTCGMVPGTRAQKEALFALLRALDADGVVWHYLRGCAPIASAQGPIIRALREAGMPTLTIETDASQEDTEGLRTRIEAFIEMMR